MESDKETKGDPIVLDIQSIDIIHNPDYDKIRKSYTLPVFFKCDYDLSKGHLDNGRHLVPLDFKEQDTIFGRPDESKYGSGTHRVGPSRK